MRPALNPVFSLSGTPRMNFGTLLFSDQKPRDDERPQPASFHDLFLDQIVAAAIRGREEYDLARFFYRPLDSVEDIGFRQAIVTDLERPPLWVS